MWHMDTWQLHTWHMHAWNMHTRTHGHTDAWRMHAWTNGTCTSGTCTHGYLACVAYMAHVHMGMYVWAHALSPSHLQDTTHASVGAWDMRAWICDTRADALPMTCRHGCVLGHAQDVGWSDPCCCTLGRRAPTLVTCTACVAWANTAHGHWCMVRRASPWPWGTGCEFRIGRVRSHG